MEMHEAQRLTISNYPSSFLSCVLCSLAADISLLTQSAITGSFAPTVTLSRMHCCPSFANTREQHAYEFMNVLAMACNKVDLGAFLHLTDGIIHNTATEKTTPYWLLCAIKGTTSTKCSVCGQTVKDNWINDVLSLPLPPGRCHTQGMSGPLHRDGQKNSWR